MDDSNTFAFHNRVHEKPLVRVAVTGLLSPAGSPLHVHTIFPLHMISSGAPLQVHSDIIIVVIICVFQSVLLCGCLNMISQAFTPKMFSN